ncbi:mast cell protease 8-like [Orycteropus afer afer]|uniref:Mast cell protease 8-like n=1 Tax=Orycteropus afer afer TaxID=1230840 RepID=A0A8B7AMT6_ORYAF|nr:mast cell protease 8-like [Orycteropus afer afer]
MLSSYVDNRHNLEEIRDMIIEPASFLTSWVIKPGKETKINFILSEKMLPILLLLAFPLLSEAFIVTRGGTETRPHSLPYMARIGISADNLKWDFCAGFLVREDFVMTAAHCYRAMSYVILGAHNSTISEPTIQVIPVHQHFPHPEFKTDTFDNDIMLLKLKYTAQLSMAVKTIALPQSKDWVKPKQVCSMAGWGKMDNDRYSGTLREVDLEVQEKKICNQTYSHYNDATQLCVGNPWQSKSAEMGDLGGPLVCNSVAQGIVSHGYNTTSTGVYTRISSFVPWISRIMNAS